MKFKTLVLFITLVLVSACTSMNKKPKKSYLDSNMGQKDKLKCESGNYSSCLSLALTLNSISSSQQDLQMALKYAKIVCNADKTIYHAGYMGCMAAERIKNGRQIKLQAMESGYCLDPIERPKPTPNGWIQMYEERGC